MHPTWHHLPPPPLFPPQPGTLALSGVPHLYPHAAAVTQHVASTEALTKNEDIAKEKTGAKEEKAALTMTITAGLKRVRDEDTADAQEVKTHLMGTATPPPSQKRHRMNDTLPSSLGTDADASLQSASASSTSSLRIHIPSSMLPPRKPRVASTVAKHSMRQQFVEDEMDEQLDAVATGTVPVAAMDDVTEDGDYADDRQDEESVDQTDTDASVSLSLQEKQSVHANVGSSIPTPPHRYALWQQQQQLRQLHYLQQQQQQHHLTLGASPSKLWLNASHLGPRHAYGQFSHAAFARGKLLSSHPVPGSALANYQQLTNAYALQSDTLTTRNDRRIGTDRRRRFKLNEALDSLRHIILRHGRDASAYDQVSVLCSSIDLMHSFEHLIEHQIAMLQTQEKTLVALNQKLRMYESAEHHYVQQAAAAAAMHVGIHCAPVPVVAPATSMVTATSDPPASAPCSTPAPTPKMDKKIKQRNSDPMAALVQVANADNIN